MMHSDYFPHAFQEFVYFKSYSRWRPDLGRREYWPETVDRYCDFIFKHRDASIPKHIQKMIKEYILEMKALPTTRSLWAAGQVAEKDNTAIFPCAYVPIDHYKVFGEILLILMNATGVGYSVEKEFIGKLPVIPSLGPDSYGTHTIKDSREGWQRSVDLLFKARLQGKDIIFSYDEIRKEGTPLKTMGGRASGFQPLKNLHEFIEKTLTQAAGRQLTDLECHDICCMIAEGVVVGGVYQAAEISFSDLDSKEMRFAKHGNFPRHRYMANNTAVYKSKPSSIDFLREWVALAESGTGERGILNLSNLNKIAPRRIFTGKERTNPCAEAILYQQFCNLTEIVVRAGDSFDDLRAKAKIAVWLGCIHASFTNFPNLRSIWKKNCEEIVLLGVSLTGQMDNRNLLTSEKLQLLKDYVIKTARKASIALNIRMPVAITCSKPSGTISQLTDCSPGMLARFSEYYIRRYRIPKLDPLYRVLKDSGFELHPDNGQTKKDAATWVVKFPVKAPKKAILQNKLTVMEQLEWYKKVQTNWCEHNVSCTIYVKDDEWIDVGKWVYENWEDVVAMSFYPYDGAKYEQPPFEAITKKEYNTLVEKTPKIDYELLKKYELEDMTTAAKELACVAGGCDIN